MTGFRQISSLLVLSLAGFALAGGLASGQTKAKSAPKTAATKKSSPKKSTAKKSTAKKSTKKAAAKPRTPTPERYAEIERALELRGYLSGTDGKWDQESVAALRRFQKDQSLKDDGKLGALSLIALGLGPKRTTITAQSISGSAPAPQVE